MVSVDVKHHVCLLTTATATTTTTAVSPFSCDCKHAVGKHKEGLRKVLLLQAENQRPVYKLASYSQVIPDP